MCGCAIFFGMYFGTTSLAFFSEKQDLLTTIFFYTSNGFLLLVGLQMFIAQPWWSSLKQFIGRNSRPLFVAPRQKPPHHDARTEQRMFRQALQNVRAFLTRREERNYQKMMVNTLPSHF